MAGNPLGRLIDTTREANGWSDQDVALRAERAGHQLSKSKLSDIRVNGVKTVVPAMIYAIAAGLSLPVTEVLRAALEATGLPAFAPSASPEEAIRTDPALSEETKRALLAVIRSARDERIGQALMGRADVAAGLQRALDSAQRKRSVTGRSQDDSKSDEVG